MKKMFSTGMLALCLILPIMFMLTACGGKSGEYYVTTLPEEYEIVLRTKYYASGQYKYMQETFIVCVEDGHAEPTYYYKYEDFGTDETYTTNLSSDDVLVRTDHRATDWFDLSDAVFVSVGLKYLDADITNKNEDFNGVMCISYNYQDMRIEKISKDDYHLR